MDRFRFLLGYINKYRFSYLLGIVFIILTNLIAVNIPKYLQLSIDLLSKNLEQSRDQLFEYILVILILACAMIFVRALSRIFFFNPGRAIEYRLKNDLFAKLTQLQKNYYDQNPTGGITSRLQNDITGVRLICGFGMMQIFNILSALSLTPYKMWQLSPNLTLYCVIPVVLAFVAVRGGMHFVVTNMRLRMTSLQGLSGYTVSSLTGIDVIKGYNLFDWSTEKFDLGNKEIRERAIKISFVRSFLMPLIINLENFLKTLILVVGGYYVLQADFTIGELTAFIAYAGLLTHPLMGLGWVTTMFQQGLVGLASLETIIQQRIPFASVPSLPSAELATMFDNGLRIQNFSYKYEEQDEAVLKDIDFTILPGQTVGILGKIGSGKTTLVNCLNRYLSVDDGHIFFGDRDSNHLNFADVRKCIHTVTQEPFLFSDTVEKNILFGDTEENKARGYLDQVIHESSLEEEIQRFPEGKKTMVGEKGIMLSGGQKQRISLARALITECDLLILDNVLSAVDYETERFLLEQIHQRKKSRSLLIVSHRAKALEKADRILILEKGRIVDQGNFQELLGRPGYFRETWELQNQEAEQE